MLVSLLWFYKRANWSMGFVLCMEMIILLNIHKLIFVIPEKCKSTMLSKVEKHNWYWKQSSLIVTSSELWVGSSLPQPLLELPIPQPPCSNQGPSFHDIGGQTEAQQLECMSQPHAKLSPADHHVACIHLKPRKTKAVCPTFQSQQGLLQLSRWI